MNLNELNNELETLFKEEQLIDNFSETRVLNFKKKERKNPMRYILPIGAIFAICLLAINLFPFGASPTSDNNVSEEDQERLQLQEETIEDYKEQLKVQKQLFERLIKDIPEESYDLIAEELVSYTLTLNDRRFSVANMTALTGEFQLTVGEMYSEVFDTTENERLKDLYNEMVEREALLGITLLTNHPLEQIDSSGSLSNGYGFKAESTTKLKEINPKIIFELTPYLQEKIKLKSNILTIEFSDKPFVPLSFINDEHYANHHEQNYLVEQTRMLNNAIAKIAELHPNPEALLKMIDEQTTFKLQLLTDSTGETVDITTHEVIVNYEEQLVISLNNPLFLSIPGNLYDDYLNVIDEQIKFIINDGKLNYYKEKRSTNNDFRQPAFSLNIMGYFNPGDFPLKVELPTEIINRLDFPYKSVIVYNYYNDPTNIDYEIKNMENYLPEYNKFFHYLLDEIPMTEIDAVVEELKTYSIKLNGIDVLNYSPNALKTSNSFSLEVEEVLSEILMDSNHPKLLPYINQLNDETIKLQTNKGLETIHLKDETINKYTYHSNDSSSIGKAGDLLTFKLNPYLQNKIGISTLDIEIDDSPSPSLLEKTEQQLRFDYLRNQLDMITNAIDKLVEIHPNEDKLFEALHEMTTLESLKYVVDNDGYKDFTTNEISIDSFHFGLDLSLKNPYSHVFTFNMRELYKENYPITNYFTLSNNNYYTSHFMGGDYQSFSMHSLGTEPGTLTLTFTDEIVEELNLPHKTLTLHFKGETQGAE